MLASSHYCRWIVNLYGIAWWRGVFYLDLMVIQCRERGVYYDRYRCDGNVSDSGVDISA